MSKKMVLVDTSKCTGCKACSAACKEWNELPAVKTSLVKSYQSQKDFGPNTWTFISFDEKFENNKFAFLMRKKQCFHCTDAACLKGCPAGAISKSDYGNVVIDHDICIGCGYCVQNCPFGVPSVDESAHKSYKCTGCINRVENGLNPACVSICQPGALQAGDENEIMAIAKERLAVVKESHPSAILYGESEMGGTNWIYILLDSPTAYGLPVNPQLPASLTAWRDVIRPAGGAIIGLAAAAVVVGTIANVAKGNYKDEDADDSGKHSESKGENM